MFLTPVITGGSVSKATVTVICAVPSLLYWSFAVYVTMYIPGFVKSTAESSTESEAVTTPSTVSAAVTPAK